MYVYTSLSSLLKIPKFDLNLSSELQTLNFHLHTFRSFLQIFIFKKENV